MPRRVPSRHPASSSFPPRFVESDLIATMDPKTLARGRAYQRDGAVVDLVVEAGGTVLYGAVRGRERELYEVDVEVDLDADILPVINGMCTCPVGYNCKHVAAVLLEALARHASPASTASPFNRVVSVPPPDPLAGAVGAWVRAVGDSVRTPENAPDETILHLFDTRADADGRTALTVTPTHVKRRKDGAWGSPRTVSFPSLASGSARAADRADQVIGRLHVASPRSFAADPTLPDDPDMVDLLLERLLATGRVRWRDRNGPVLTRGPERTGRLTWRLAESGRQVPNVELDDGEGTVLVAARPWWTNPEQGMCGPLNLPLPRSTVPVLLRAPPIEIGAARAVASALRERLSVDESSLPRDDFEEVVDDDPPIPCLRLESREVRPPYSYGRYASPPAIEDLAILDFDYDGRRLSPSDPARETRRVDGTRVVTRRRRLDAERAAFARLAGTGLLPEGTFPSGGSSRAELTFADGDSARWLDFSHRVAPELEAEGWRVERAEGFRHVVAAPDEWNAEIEDRGAWWFGFDLGVEIGGERVSLLPVLVDALSRVRDLRAPDALERLAVNGTVFGRLADGRTVALPFERVRAIFEVLIEVFDGGGTGDGAFLNLSLAQAEALTVIMDATRARWIGGSRLRDLVYRLRAIVGETPVSPPPPEGLQVTLRPYQRDGLGWLRFLAENNLGGILADDMGLGKTIQTLAHIQSERESGRLDGPCLVIGPTSLVSTWMDEATRFVPGLVTLALHGPRRAADFERVAEADLVVTTYPLLLRDFAVLKEIDWDLVILDEAQVIKNPLSKVTQAACRLRARRRLCLTGTPVENHLGEAWSQFAFLMPGLLGDLKTFTQVFRTPIEKRGDAERKALLARRLKPFLLRRTKAAVAADLPPKTEIVQRVELEGAQRDLYETLRLAMHEKVRAAVRAKGIARSGIVILDALLKLRQVCCDPRLVKLVKTGRAAPSAKLNTLLDMLPTLIAEGRRILLFSQFTGMLDLIKPELDALELPFVELTGDTVDRAGRVRAFQRGDVPLFLISLKAGGTGLTLTAADTVIHYDPWWNPAVEDQATDRAHRIGQDKPVFVHKLICAGTVEERMVEMQARKRAVAGALFDAENADAAGFSEDDLEALFQPLS